jgi:hypothetical protein
MTLLSAKQQKRKASKHIQSTLQAKEIIIGFATLFIICRTKKTQQQQPNSLINNTTNEYFVIYYNIHYCSQSPRKP